MDTYNILLYFVAGGAAVAGAVIVARIGHPFLSGLAILFPSATVVSYYFIGKTAGAAAVNTSIRSTIFSSLVVWLPYMITLAYLAPRMGVNNALIISILVYLVIGSVWTFVNYKYGLI